MRSDTRRNRRRLLEAAATLVREDPQAITLVAVAARAEISVATTYRYFSSLDELLAALMQAVLNDFVDFGDSCADVGEGMFDLLLGRWVELMVGAEGPVMVQLRSRAGFLQRLHDGDPVIAAMAHAWRPAVISLLASSGAGEDQLPQALMLLNVLIDPREILDMAHALKMSPPEIRATLSATYRAGLSTWLERIGASSPRAEADVATA
jgi:AcrR family transcriptional regulator